MSSQKPAYIRTGAPMAAGSTIVYIAKTFGLELTVDQALVIAPVVMYAYYVLGRALESYSPKLGYVLGVAKQPAYASGGQPAPDKGQDVVAVTVPEPGTPEQTDNRPRLEDGEQPPEDVALGATDFTGGMR